MTTEEVRRRLEAGQPLEQIELQADWDDNVFAYLPPSVDDQGEALFIRPICEVR